MLPRGGALVGPLAAALAGGPAVRRADQARVLPYAVVEDERLDERLVRVRRAARAPLRDFVARAPASAAAAVVAPAAAALSRNRRALSGK